MPQKQPNLKQKVNKDIELHRKIMLFLLACVAIVLLTISTARNINRSLFVERSTNIQMLMERIALNIEDALSTQWGQLEYFKNDFLDHQPTSMEGVLSYLSETERRTSSRIKRIYVIDDQARCYRSDGKSFRWKDSAALLSEQWVCSISTETFQISNLDARMLFVMPFDEALSIADKKITHIAIAVDMEFIQTFFEIEDFGESSVSFIISESGTQIYSEDKSNSLSGVYNLMQALEQDAQFYYGGSVEILKQDIANHQPGCVMLNLGETQYFLAYEPLSTNHWTSVLMLEANSFSSGATGMAVSIIISVSILLFSAGGIVILIILVMTHRTNQKLRAAADAEREANLAKTRFMSSMSHDIRTPMNAIIGMTELAMTHMEDHPYVKSCLTKVRLSADHLLTLINDILDVSQIESGQTKLSPGPVSLSILLDKLAEILAPQIQERKQTLSLSKKDLLVEYVYADQLRLTQIMLNLLSNASKYTPKGGIIWVYMTSKELTEEPGMVQIVYTVRDNGIGMSNEFQQMMYNAFSREKDTTQSQIQGTGLGLSICKQLVDLMGGTIECQSEVDEGTTFTVTVKLPAAVAPQEEIASKAGLASVDSLEGLKILVAEDNDFNWEISHELLKMSGIKTVRAENGQVCFDMISVAEEDAYDLILMDIQMPVMNGYQSAEAIRSSQREYLKRIPIIAVTADAFSEDIQRCLEAGMDAHVSKPIDPQKLLEVIQNIQSRNGGKHI